MRAADGNPRAVFLLSVVRPFVPERLGQLVGSVCDGGSDGIPFRNSFKRGSYLFSNRKHLTSRATEPKRKATESEGCDRSLARGLPCHGR